MRRRYKVDPFVLLFDLSEYTVQASSLLCESLTDYDEETLETLLEQMREIEHTANLILHDYMHKLAHSYSRYVSREDVGVIANLIDDATGKIADVLMYFAIFKLYKLRSEAVEYAGLLSRGTVTLTNLVREFRNYKSSLRARELILEINKIEEEGNSLYASSMHRLFSDGDDAKELIIWTNLFDRFEACCDSLKDVSAQIESVIIKTA